MENPYRAANNLKQRKEILCTHKIFSQELTIKESMIIEW